MNENSGASCSKDIDPTDEIDEQGPRDRTLMWQGGGRGAKTAVTAERQNS